MPPAEVERVRELIEMLDAGVPGEYRLELFRAWLPRTVGPESDSGRARHPVVPTPAPDLAASSDRWASVAEESGRLDLAGYAPLLVLSGRPLLKALAALDVAHEQLGVDWMTPAEIEFLLTERAHVRSVYRTNVSTALGDAGDLVDRQRRGRGFEYRLTAAGREALRRELRLRGAPS